MSTKDDIEKELDIAARALDRTLPLLKSYELEQDHLVLTSVKEAIGNVVVALLHFERARKRFEEPVRNACSFCNKKETEVVTLIKGPQVFICNECVDMCKKILN